MDWKDLLIYIIQSLCGLVISVGIPYIFTLIRKKIKDEKLARIIDRVENIVSKTVTLVNQTYVDALKESNLFDKEAQIAAFEMCKERVLAMLNDEAVKAIAETFGDFDEWIRTLIEAYVRDNKVSVVEITQE
jgi:molecular chaperone GrpE (heat shock protein)